MATVFPGTYKFYRKRRRLPSLLSTAPVSTCFIIYTKLSCLPKILLSSCFKSAGLGNNMHETSRNVARKIRLSYGRERFVLTFNTSYIISVGCLVTLHCIVSYASRSSKLNPESLLPLKFHWFHSRGVLSHEHSLHYRI